MAERWRTSILWIAGLCLWCGGPAVAEVVSNLWKKLEMRNRVWTWQKPDITDSLKHKSDIWENLSRVCTGVLSMTFTANKPGMSCPLKGENIYHDSWVFALLNHSANSQPPGLMGIIENAIIFYQYDSIINSYLGNLIIPQTSRCLIGTPIICTFVFCPVCQRIQL